MKYVLCGGFVAYLLYSLASRLREREHALVERARQTMQEEFLARAGALAAGAAHEMSAPLCTMAVVVNELMRQRQPRGFAHSLQLVSEQIEACRRILGELMASGKVTPVIDRCYRLSEVPEAIRYLEEGHARGKVVITFE